LASCPFSLSFFSTLFCYHLKPSHKVRGLFFHARQLCFSEHFAVPSFPQRPRPHQWVFFCCPPQNLHFFVFSRRAFLASRGCSFVFLFPPLVTKPQLSFILGFSFPLALIVFVHDDPSARSPIPRPLTGFVGHLPARFRDVVSHRTPFSALTPFSPGQETRLQHRDTLFGRIIFFSQLLLEA